MSRDKDLVCSFCQKEIKGNAKNWGFMGKGAKLDINFHGKCKDVYDKMVVQESNQTLLTELLEELEKLDVSGGGSGRRFKEQFKAIIESRMK